ncbi:MAG: hypothetical protein K2R93_12540 [Gemmatimonadaceae bacterium]|nr:hypothetical protein [Gemmatimonadaceae bacterium]
MTKRKETRIEWVRMAEAARRLKVPRTTLIHRVAKGEHKTKVVGDTVFVAVPKAA